MIEIVIHIKDGQITNRAAVARFKNDHKDGSFLWSSKTVSKRSDNQNRYYWGCVVAMIRDRMIGLGNDVDSELVHCYLKDRFNSKELFSKDGVNIGSIGDTTTKLSKLDFEMYLEKVKQFAAEVLDIYIPNPNEQLTTIF